jgi:hypothetical protein
MPRNKKPVATASATPRHRGWLNRNAASLARRCATSNRNAAAPRNVARTPTENRASHRNVARTSTEIAQAIATLRAPQPKSRKPLQRCAHLNRNRASHRNVARASTKIAQTIAIHRKGSGTIAIAPPHRRSALAMTVHLLDSSHKKGRSK